MSDVNSKVEQHESRIQELEETISFLELKVSKLDDALIDLNNGYHEMKLDNLAFKNILKKVMHGSSGGEMGDIVREDPANGVNR